MRVRCQEFADSVGLVVARLAQTIGAEPFFGLLLVGLQAGLLARTVALHLLVVEDTAAHFDEFLRLMPARGESEHSWTVTREQID